MAEELKWEAHCAYEDKDFQKALAKWQEALELEMKISSNYNEIGELLHCIGNAHVELFKFDEALLKYEEAVETRKKEKHPDFTEIGVSLHRIGLVYEKQNKLDEALQKYKEALKIKKKTKQHDNKTIGSTLFKIADVYQALNKQDEALAKYEECLQMFKIDEESAQDSMFEKAQQKIEQLKQKLSI